MPPDACAAGVGQRPSTFRIHSSKLTITHICAWPIAPHEFAVILSVTPNHGGVTDASRHQQQRNHLAGGRTLCGNPSRQASGPPAAMIAGTVFSRTGQANPRGLR